MPDGEPVIDVKMSRSDRRSLATVFPRLKATLDLDSPESIVVPLTLSSLVRIFDSLIPIALMCNDKRFRISNIVPSCIVLGDALNKHDPVAFDNRPSAPARQPVPSDTELTVELSSDQRNAIGVLFPDQSSMWHVGAEGPRLLRFSAVRFQSIRDSLIPYAISCGNDIMQQNLTDTFIEMWNVFPVCDIYTK